MIAAMHGLDGVIFTGGIGENAPPVRDMILHRLSWTGISGNSAAHKEQNQSTGRPRARVIAADEEGEIAYCTRAVLGTHAIPG